MIAEQTNVRNLAIKLRNTPLEQLKLSNAVSRLPKTGVESVDVYRNLFIWIAVYTSGVEGIDWQPPSLNSTTEVLEASFEKLLSQLENLDVMVEWYEAIHAFTEPLASEVEKPETTLTDSEKKAQPSQTAA